ncbi:ECF RNA polymerase sigma factor SigE [Anatilimnocola aggregata]|uniref:ECF RNA polymerase sigma factor SigE n=1 Tax=Anatilimnocola aggregata TaxID=2528021 RepID=A0A517YMA2_9BACT|nr:sigma-70 family RNA polymerase sigma factor [Anatilimnocola aggregata]QDU31358.1 ECF RNA polymerase sigma factor SigE [Anatilimnocola aggregata]
MDEMKLLHDYATTGSQAAFSELVSRHIDWVYGVSLRRAGDAATAEDVTQAVFIVLAKKAKSLPQNTVLIGWLMNVIHYAAADARKAQSRRRQHELKAAEMRLRTTNSPTDQGEVQELLPLVDEAMTRLPTAYRDAVGLRFYGKKSFGELALALGLSEEAAKKRVSRGLEKLRGMLRGRVGAITVTTVTTALTAASAEAAPSGLQAQVLLATTAAQAGGALLVAQGAMNMMAWANVKFAAVAAAIVLGSVGTPMAVVYALRDAKSTMTASERIASLGTASTPITHSDSSDESFILDGGAGLARTLDRELLRFTHEGGAFAWFHLSVPILSVPGHGHVPAEVVIERHGESAAMLVRSTHGGWPYAYVIDNLLVQLDPETPGGLVVAEGVAPEAVIRAPESARRPMTELSVAVSTQKRIDVNIGSLIEELQRDATGRSYDENFNLVRLSSPDAGGRISLAPNAPPGSPPVSSYSVTESVRLAFEIREISVNPQAASLPKLTLPMLESLGLSIRRITREAAVGSLLPTTGFFDNREHRAAAVKLDSLLERRARKPDLAPPH